MGFLLPQLIDVGFFAMAIVRQLVGLVGIGCIQLAKQMITIDGESGQCPNNLEGCN